MRKLIVTVAVLLITIMHAYASDTTRVLFIGNSFTGVEDVPGLVKGLANAAGQEMEIFQHTPGGISVGDIAQGNEAHMNNPIVYQLIRENKLDYVVLQDNQGRFVLQNGFPNPAQSQVVAGHLKILDSMKAHHSCARMLFFAGWALKNCWSDIGTGEQCIINIYRNYKTLNIQAKEIIAPIGAAWIRSGQLMPNVDLWSPDEAHQSHAGGYLTAAVIFSTIYKQNGEGVMFNANLDDATSQTLRTVAFQTVMDSLQNSGLSDYTPTLVNNNGTLVAASGYSVYNWYKSDTLISTTNTNTYIPNQKGCYRVAIQNSQGCFLRSFPVCVELSNAIDGIAKNSIKLLPNPAKDNLLLTMQGFSGVKKYHILNMQGKVVLEGVFDSENTQLNIAHLADGVYICKVWIGAKTFYTKLTKN